MLSVAYRGETEQNNSKGLIFRLTPTDTYGVAAAGDLIDLTPSNVSDPGLKYNEILNEPPENMGVLNANLGGSTVALKPNAAPSLSNLGLLVYEPGGTEKTTNAVYTADELAGFVDIVVFLPLQ